MHYPEHKYHVQKATRDVSWQRREELRFCLSPLRYVTNVPLPPASVLAVPYTNYRVSANGVLVTIP